MFNFNDKHLWCWGVAVNSQASHLKGCGYNVGKTEQKKDIFQQSEHSVFLFLSTHVIFYIEATEVQDTKKEREGHVQPRRGEM